MGDVIGDYIGLGNEIIVQAVKDYKYAIRILSRGYSDSSLKVIDAKKLKDDCERFFLGDWIKELTSIDGEWLMLETRKKIEKKLKKT